MKTTYKTKRVLVEEVGSRETPAFLHTVREDLVLKITVRDTPYRISCLDGCLWVTQEGDTDDHLLRKGEEFITDRKGKVLIQSVAQNIGSGEESTVRIA